MVNKRKDIYLLITFLIFTLTGTFFGEQKSFAPTIIFGLGTLFQTYKVFIARPKKNIPDDELFLKFHGDGSLEYYDWGFYDEILETEYYWEDIIKIITFKKDVITHDSVCINCLFKDGREFIVDEETPGWNQFRLALQKQFDFDDSWLSKVALPAFERNEAVLYSKVTATID